MKKESSSNASPSKLKWKLKSASHASNLRYRTLVDCENFLLQKTWVGSSKVRILTKPSIGMLVVCSAPSVPELWEVWELCCKLVPPLDDEGRIRKSAVVGMLQPYAEAYALKASLFIRSPTTPKQATTAIPATGSGIIATGYASSSSRSSSPRTQPHTPDIRHYSYSGNPTPSPLPPRLGNCGAGWSCESDTDGMSSAVSSARSMPAGQASH